MRTMLFFQLWSISVHPRFVGIGESLLEVSHKKVARVPCLDSSCSSWASLARFFAAWRDDWQLQGVQIWAQRLYGALYVAVWFEYCWCMKTPKFNHSSSIACLEILPWNINRTTEQLNSYCCYSRCLISASVCCIFPVWKAHDITTCTRRQLFKALKDFSSHWMLLKDFTSTRQAPSNNSSPLWSLLHGLLQHSLGSWFLTNTKDLSLA